MFVDFVLGWGANFVGIVKGGRVSKSLRTSGLGNTHLDHLMRIKSYLNAGRTVDLHKAYTMRKEQKVRRQKI